MELVRKKEIAIIGFGRFGQVLAKLLTKNFTLCVHDTKLESELQACHPEYRRGISSNSLDAYGKRSLGGTRDDDEQNIQFVSLEKALECTTLFLAVPISAFSELVKNISGKLKAGTTVIDVCSVKVHPVKIMQEFLPDNIDIIATHPLFGPDSFERNADLSMMMHAVRDKNNKYEFWKKHFEHQHIHIIEMTPEAHDEAAAFSQGITHYIGRILEAMEIKSTLIDTAGFKKLLSLKDQTCNDTWQLYCDLQHYNPYSINMQAQFEAAIKKIGPKS
jgi:prephenate dehydrogenase